MDQDIAGILVPFSLPANAAHQVLTVSCISADSQRMSPESWPEVFWPDVPPFPQFPSQYYVKAVLRLIRRDVHPHFFVT